MHVSAVSPNTFDPYTIGYQMGVSLDDAINAYSTSAEAIEDRVAAGTGPDPVRDYEKLVTQILYSAADLVGAFTGKPKIQYPSFEEKQSVEPLVKPEENKTETDSVQDSIREEIKNAIKKFQTPEENVKPVQDYSTAPNTVQESPTPIKVVPYKIGDRVGY